MASANDFFGQKKWWWFGNGFCANDGGLRTAFLKIIIHEIFIPHAPRTYDGDDDDYYLTKKLFFGNWNQVTALLRVGLNLNPSTWFGLWPYSVWPLCNKFEKKEFTFFEYLTDPDSEMFYTECTIYRINPWHTRKVPVLKATPLLRMRSADKKWWIWILKNQAFCHFFYHWHYFQLRNLTFTGRGVVGGRVVVMFSWLWWWKWLWCHIIQDFFDTGWKFWHPHCRWQIWLKFASSEEFSASWDTTVTSLSHNCHITVIQCHTVRHNCQLRIQKTMPLKIFDFLKKNLFHVTS